MSCEKKNQTTESFWILLRILGCWEGSQKAHEATFCIHVRGESKFFDYAIQLSLFHFLLKQNQELFLIQINL